MGTNLEEKKPFIHLFNTSIGYYFFDVNTDSIVNVSKEVYDKIRHYEENENDLELNKLKKAGLLQPNRKRYTAHSETEYIPFYFQRDLNTLVLQVTQNCNQRCSYCVYSGNYENRTHSHKRMSFEMAKKGIDLVLNNSSDAEELYFGFYGGEPLLEKELIKKCISYIDENVEDKKVYYNITTNATLLTSDILELLVKHKVSLLISLDGPEEIHNKNRGFPEGTGNPHNIILNNLNNLRVKYPKYYKESVSFNTVLNGKDGFKNIDYFFKENDLFSEVKVMSTLVSDNYSKNKNRPDDVFWEELRYELFLNLLTYIGRLKKNNSKMLEIQVNSIDIQRRDKQYGDQRCLPGCSHHSGVCIPGIHKLLMNANGDFYPCEKVSESSDVCKIGNIDEGIDIEKVRTLLNLELLMQEECLKCWAYQYCTNCLINADGLNTLSKESMMKECVQIRNRLDDSLKDYVVCTELKKKFVKMEECKK